MNVNPEMAKWYFPPSPVNAIIAKLIADNAAMNMKNLGHSPLITLPNSFVANFFESVGAIIATWKIIIPAIAPGT